MLWGILCDKLIVSHHCEGTANGLCVVEMEGPERSGSTRKEGVKLGKKDLGDATGPDTQGRREGLVQNKANFRQAEVNVNLFV